MESSREACVVTLELDVIGLHNTRDHHGTKDNKIRNFSQYTIYSTRFKAYHHINTLALAGNSEAINIVGRTNTQTTTRRRLPQKTRVGAVVPVRVGLDPRSASVGH